VESRGGVLVCLSEEVGPIREAAGHEPSMDEVEGLVVDPEIFSVVD